MQSMSASQPTSPKPSRSPKITTSESSLGTRDTSAAPLSLLPPPKTSPNAQKTDLCTRTQLPRPLHRCRLHSHLDSPPQNHDRHHAQQHQLPRPRHPPRRRRTSLRSLRLRLRPQPSHRRRRVPHRRPGRRLHPRRRPLPAGLQIRPCRRSDPRMGGRRRARQPPHRHAHAQ